MFCVSRQRHRLPYSCVVISMALFGSGDLDGLPCPHDNRDLVPPGLPRLECIQQRWQVVVTAGNRRRPPGDLPFQPRRLDGAGGDELPPAAQPIKTDTVRNFFIRSTSVEIANKPDQTQRATRVNASVLVDRKTVLGSKVRNDVDG